jgi:hypothetical protein
MMPRFRKRADLHYVVLPEVGRVVPGQILEGGEFARFCPHLLERILEAPAPSPPMPKNGAIAGGRVIVTESHVTIEDGQGGSVMLSADGVQVVPAAEPVVSTGDATVPDESAKLLKRAEARRKRG